ncbi:MAG: hypothetical protein ABSE42_08965 [Bryobacteraceae bacterium]|jgi:hypothetical protein
MGQIKGSIVFLIAVALLALLLFRRWVADALIEAINNFRGGGPPTPMHPSPADDAALLRRGARKVEN